LLKGKLREESQMLGKHWTFGSLDDYYLSDIGDLRAALDAVLEGRDVPPEQIPSMGCNIKWKS